MKILYLDCFSGIAGDMLLGALVDLGADIGELRRRLESLPLRGYSLTARRAVRQGISGTKIDVKVKGRHPHRGWKEIRGILAGAGLPGRVEERALRIFRRLIEVEAAIHGIPAQKVHLHEVGAVDAIVDIAGSVLALEDLLGEEGELHASPLHLGGGSIKMAHGTYPVPPPATVALLKGVPVLAGPVEGELVTPTGAAIVSTLADSFGPMPPMTMMAVGYGAGTRQYDGHPNMLRALLGESLEGSRAAEQVVVMECTIDDMNPQGYGFLMERLFRGGAHEVFYTPVQMKKNRPGILVTVVAPRARFGEMAALIFRETTTIGLRHRVTGRVELEREILRVATPFGRVKVKVSSFQGEAVQAQPEYEDCRRIAAARDVPLKEVQAAALSAYRAVQPPPGGGSAGGRTPAGRKPDGGAAGVTGAPPRGRAPRAAPERTRRGKAVRTAPAGKGRPGKSAEAVLTAAKKVPRRRPAGPAASRKVKGTGTAAAKPSRRKATARGKTAGKAGSRRRASPARVAGKGTRGRAERRSSAAARSGRRGS